MQDSAGVRSDAGAEREMVDYVKVTVTDTGAGLTQDSVSPATSPFFRYLSIAISHANLSKAIVDLHRGRITVDSRGENLGSTFTVWWPITAPTSPDPVGFGSLISLSGIVSSHM
eukprot:gene224-229_t